MANVEAGNGAGNGAGDSGGRYRVEGGPGSRAASAVTRAGAGGGCCACTCHDVREILPSVLILLVGLTIMVLVIPYAFRGRSEISHG